MTIEGIARVCHAANRAYCTMIGDYSHTIWDKSSDSIRSGIIAGVKFTLENPDATPESQHQAWYKQKEADGWRYGPVKNTEDKEHPCMLPYDMLPKQQRIKDALFQAIVKSLAPALPVVAS